MKAPATVVFVTLVALILAGCVAPQATAPASPNLEPPATATMVPATPTAAATSVPATPAPSPTPRDAETPAPTPWPTVASVTTGDFPCDLTRWVAPTPLPSPARNRQRR